MLRRIAMLVVLSSVGLACSGDAAPDGPGNRDGSADPGGLRPPMTPDGPVRGLALGDALGDRTIEGQRLAFTTDDTSATAFVFLGSDVEDGSRLTVMWYRGFGEGREELFSHEIAVGPNAIAYSQGVAEPGLAPGLYEVEASFDGHRVRLPWVVQTPDEPTEARSRHAVVAQSTLEDWEIPTPGERGTTDWDTYEPPPGGSPPSTCEADSIIGGMSPMTDVTAAAFALGPCTELTLTAAVSGPPHVIGTDDSLAGPISSVFGSVDVCSLPGGSDLPGTVVRFGLEGSATASEEYTLPDLSPVLVAGIEGTPAEGSRVEAGDRIAVDALALLMAPAQGVKVLYVDDGAALVESVGNVSGSDRPIACDLGRYFAYLQDTYVVPDDPPPVVQLCASAEGFDGTIATDCATFFTTEGQTWTGTIEARNRGADCEGGEDGTMTLKVNGGDVVGSFEASGSYTCDGFTVQTGGSVTVEGTLDEAGFKLSFVSVEGSPAGSLICFVGSPFVLPVVGDTAKERATMTASSGDVYDCEVELHPETRP